MASSSPQPSAGRRPPTIPPPVGTGFFAGNNEDPDWDDPAYRLQIDLKLATFDLSLLQIRALQSQLRGHVRDSFLDALVSSEGNIDEALIHVLRRFETLTKRELQSLQVLMQLRLEILERWLELERTYLGDAKVSTLLAEPGSFEDVYVHVIQMYRVALASVALAVGR